jgi:hypothetical protein
MDGLGDTGPSCNNVCALAWSVLNLLITLHMPLLDDLIPSALVSAFGIWPAKSGQFGLIGKMPSEYVV